MTLRLIVTKVERDGLPKVHSIDRRIAVVELLLSNRRKQLWEVLGRKNNRGADQCTYTPKTIRCAEVPSLQAEKDVHILRRTALGNETSHFPSNVRAARQERRTLSLFTWHEQPLNFLSSTIILQQETSAPRWQTGAKAQWCSGNQTHAEQTEHTEAVSVKH